MLFVGRQVVVARGAGDFYPAKLRHLGQTEIEDLRVTSCGNEDVRRLDVAVNDALAVCGVQGVGNLDAELDYAFQFHGPVGDAMLERHPLQVLHGNESFAILFPDVVDRANVGMVQRRCSLGLALETCECLSLSGHLVGQELQRNETVEAGVFGFVDHTHAAATQLIQDGVMRDFFPEHVSRILRRPVNPSQ